ncbi:alpha/beta fold hydrolase [Telluribacter sp. SYSU D00476]|uniref:alpha/beta fold hydrolase n=1 Tax=Telluribacter sp. SYSU D00476 TaxID=2811430 RepID=UPI001FF6308F|nr:alpha/beta fold hydrolase [Telluribacter sp. SYSU D00476]
MKFVLPLIASLLLLVGCAHKPSGTSTRAVGIAKSQAKRPEVRRDTLTLFDKARNRVVPVALYSAASGKPEQKLAILNHGYGGTNRAYSFIAQALVAHGYLVASVQHELPGDEPLPTTGTPYEVRMPHWRRGVQTMLFVIEELKSRNSRVDTKHLLLIGHSHGGDMVMLFARDYPERVDKVISLDNRRMPLPRTDQLRVLSLRSSDQPADEGVLPTAAEQEKYGIQIIKLPATIHNDMWDGATNAQKQEMLTYINNFLEKK